MTESLEIEQMNAAPRASANASWVLLLAMFGSACHFTFDRSLSPGEIRGTVVMSPSSGAALVPAAGATVTLENSSVSIKTDSRGVFALTGLGPGTYGLNITAAPSATVGTVEGLHLSGITLAPVSGGLGDGRDLGQLTIGRLGGLQGTVTSAGALVAGAFVALPGITQTVTVGGAWSLSNLLPGSYSVTALYAASPGHVQVSEPQSVQVPPGSIAPSLNIALPLMPIVSQGGIAGIARLNGVASSKGVGIALAGSQTATQTSDAAGDYSETGVPAYVYTLTASAPGYQSATVPGIVVAGPTTQVPVITLAPGSNPPAQVSTVGGSFSTRSLSYHVVIDSGRAQQPSTSPNYRLEPSDSATGTGSGG